MKLKLTSVLIALTIILGFNKLNAQEKLPPYYLIGNLSKTMDDASAAVKGSLSAAGFTILGEYNPENSTDLHVIAYTRKDLQTLTIKVEDNGVLASVLKIGMKKNGDQVAVSMLNPMYLFYAYLRDDCDRNLTGLTKISDDAKKAMQSIGSDFSGFGGSEEIDDLKDYHYMAFMPYFDDPVELNTFTSFEEGLSKIQANLSAKKGKTVKVYEMVIGQEKVAIFGVGLMDPEKGEKRFLPIIGDDNIAALPYEILLVGNKASMLHGKFRFALHWPELSMSQFMKISSTPGDVEEVLEALTK